VRDEALAANKALACHFLDLCFRLDIDAAMALTAPAFSWWVLGDPARLRISGLREGARVERMLRGLRDVVPAGMRHVVLSVTAEAGRVAVEVEADGLRTTGETYRNSYHFLLRVEGGRVAAVREYMDTLAVARLMGAGAER